MAEPTFDLNKCWSEAYPELGIEPVPTEPCISPAYFALERECVFRTVWLYVGREEEVARPGDYPVRRVDVCRASVLLVRGQDGVLRGFHNVCSHRGNTLAWETTGNCKNFSCKFHGPGVRHSRQADRRARRTVLPPFRQSRLGPCTTHCCRGSTRCRNTSTPTAWTRCRPTRSGCSSSRCRLPRSPRSSSVTVGSRACRTASTSRAFAHCTPTGRRLRIRLPWRKPGGRP